MALAESLSVALTLDVAKFMAGLTKANRAAVGFARTTSKLGRHFKRGMIDPMRKMARIGVSAFKKLGSAINKTVTFAGSLSLAVGGVMSTFRAIGSAASGIVEQISPIPGVFADIGEALKAQSMVEAASKFGEIKSKFDIVFGKGVFGRADDVRQWAKTFGSAVGRSQTDLLDFLGTLQDLFVPLGFSTNQAADLSKQLTKLAVDVASLNNETDAEVLDRFKSALVGSTETVRGYGVTITQATLNQQLLANSVDGGIKKATEQQKVMARLQLIVKGTTSAQNNAIDTADSFANTMKRMQAVVTDLSVEFGTKLTKAVAGAIKKMGGVKRIKELLKIAFEIVSDLTLQFIAWGQSAGIWVSNLVTKLGDVPKMQEKIRAWIKEKGDDVRAWLGNLAGDAGDFATFLKTIPGRLDKMQAAFKKGVDGVKKLAKAFAKVAVAIGDIVANGPALAAIAGVVGGAKLAALASGGNPFAIAGGAVAGGVGAYGAAGGFSGGNQGFDVSPLPRPTPRPRRRGVYFPAARRGFATGGLVTGAPGPDAIHARLTAGEFVMPASETRTNFDLLQAIRSGQQPSGATVNVGPITVGAGASRMDVERDLLPAIERAVRRGVSRGRP